MAESTEHIALAGAETGEKTEFYSIQSNVSITSTAGEFNAGSYGYKLDYNFVVDGDGNNNVITQCEWRSLRSYKNHSWKFDLKLSALPSVESVLAWAGGNSLKIDTAGKLYYSSASKTAALSTGTWYRIEAVLDINSGKSYIRIDGAGEVSANVTLSTQTTAFIGESRKNLDPAETSPAFIAYIDDICFWYSEAGTDTTPKWWGDTQIDYRTVDANGDNTDFSGDYTAVDDYAPKNDADYNQGGAMNATQIETHNAADKTVSNTLKGFAWVIRTYDDIAPSIAERTGAMVAEEIP